MSALVCQVTEHCEFDRAEVGFNSFLPGPRLQGVLRLRSPFLRDLQRHDVLQSGEVLCGSQVIALPFPVFGQLEQPFPFHSHSISFPWHPMAFRCTSHALPMRFHFPSSSRIALGSYWKGLMGAPVPRKRSRELVPGFGRLLLLFFFLGGVADYYYFFFFSGVGGALWLFFFLFHSCPFRDRH